MSAAHDGECIALTARVGYILHGLGLCCERNRWAWGICYMDHNLHHCLLELFGCPSGLLDDEDFVAASLRQAAGEGLTTLLHEVSHHFDPQGVTALGLIAESHVAIHTWPETGYVAVDILTCGQQADPEKACAYLVKAFEAQRHTLQTIARGEPAANDKPSP